MEISSDIIHRGAKQGLSSNRSNLLSFYPHHDKSTFPTISKQIKINTDNEDVNVNTEDSNNNSLDVASFTNDPTTVIPNATDPMGTAPITEDHTNSIAKGVTLLNTVVPALETDMATSKSPLALIPRSTKRRSSMMEPLRPKRPAPTTNFE
ncbi:hypothetical protein V6N13_019977 [Hibiscus sabdariffa]|uniref:Uncharacterized protein n=1 Tax=Hibiscus sabdariffa TaxID=183260 RepID=A0ABR2ES30_9ROSI